MQTVTTTKKQLAAAIEKLELAGKKIALHSALGSFGHLEGGAHTFVETFLQNGCTLVVPTFTYACEVGPVPGWSNNADEGQLNRHAQAYEPDANYISADMGAIPGEILKFPARVRGRHPIDSLTALGPGAEEIGSSQEYDNLYNPYEMLYSDYADSSVMLLVGVDLTSATPVHFAETKAGRRLFRRLGRLPDGEVETSVGGCSNGFEKLHSVVSDIQRNATADSSVWCCFPFRLFVDRVSSAILAKPDITCCDDPGCLRCRDAFAGGPIFTGSAG